MKRLILLFLIFLSFCGKSEPEVIVNLEYAGAFEIMLSFEYKNIDYVDSVVIKRNQGEYTPEFFVFYRSIGKFKDTTVSPDFSYNYDVRVFGSDNVSGNINVKTGRPSGYYMIVSPLYLETNKDFSVNLEIYNVNNLFGISGRLLFNSSILRVDSVKKGSIWDGDDILFNVIKGDTIIFAVTKQRGESSITGSGKILKVYFSKLSAGAFYIEPMDIWLYDKNGSYLLLPEIKKSYIKVE